MGGLNLTIQEIKLFYQHTERSVCHMPVSATTLTAIFNAAEELFVAHNYADVSMRDIARAADVSTGALYHHFPSKEQLYCAMLTAYLGRVQEQTRAAIPPVGSCRERLRALTRVYLALPPAQRKLMLLVRRDLNALQSSVRAEIVRAYQQAVPELVEQVLREAIRDGELKPQDARWLAWVYVGIVQTTLTDYAQQTLGDPDAQLDAALDIFLDGARRS